MKRYRDDRPVDVCFARGTFNSHPYVMAAMHEFLRQLETPEIKALYADLDETWNARADDAQPPARCEGPARARRQHVEHLDGLLYPAVPLQLDAAILPAPRGPGSELGRAPAA